MVDQARKQSGRRSISTTLFIASALLTLGMLVVAGAAMSSIDKLSALRRESDTMTEALRNHVEGDMMHDAMRSTVLAAQIAGASGDRDAARAARTDLEEYSSWLDRLYADNATLDLPADVKAELDKVEADFDAYVAKVERIVTVSLRDPKAGAALMPDFDKTFREMEVHNEEVSDKLEKYAQDRGTQVRQQLEWMTRTLIVAALLLVAMIAAMVFYLRSRIVLPVVRMSQSLAEGASGDLSEDAGRNDEIGQLAASVSEFRDATLAIQKAEMGRIEAEREAARQEAAELDRRRELAQTAAGLEERVIAISAKVTDTTAKLKQVADALSDSANRSRTETTSASAAAQQTLTGVMTIAEATDEMLVSINEISSRISYVAKSGEQVRNLADVAEHTMSDLNAMADRIGKVSVLIGEIAARTNLLALNATIEAARAGEAGRGFAVVAEEVKQLARQTSSSVHDIELQIEAMTEATRSMSGSISSVSAAIDTLSDATISIASAAEQQGLATGEISRTIHQSSEGTQAMRQNLVQVEQQVQETASSAKTVLNAARELDEQAALLGSEIAEFISRTKAA